MKKVFICALCALAISIFATAETPEKICTDIDSLLDQNAQYSVEMKVFRGTKESEYALEIFSKVKDCVSVVKEPLYDKGTVYLMKNSNSWIYYPRNKKTIRTGNKETILGSDFTFNEVAGISLLENYIPKSIELADSEWDTMHFKNETTEQVRTDGVVLECVLREGKKMSYPTIRVFAKSIGDKFYVVREEFYTLSNKLLGVILFDDIKKLDGKVRACKLVMYSTLNEKNYSVLKYVSANYDAQTPDMYFTSTYLPKLSQKIH